MQGAHITCSCPREEKLPVLELLFIHTQRQKVRDLGGMSIGAPDFPESQRQTNYQERRELDEQRKQAWIDKYAAEAKEMSERTEAEAADDCREVPAENEEAKAKTNFEHMKKKTPLTSQD